MYYLVSHSITVSVDPQICHHSYREEKEKECLIVDP